MVPSPLHNSTEAAGMGLPFNPLIPNERGRFLMVLVSAFAPSTRTQTHCPLIKHFHQYGEHLDFLLFPDHAVAVSHKGNLVCQHCQRQYSVFPRSGRTQSLLDSV